MSGNFCLKANLHSWIPLVTDLVTQSVKMGEMSFCLEVLNTFLNGNIFWSCKMPCKSFSVSWKSIFTKRPIYTTWFSLLHIGLPNLLKWKCASILKFLILFLLETISDLACYLKVSQFHESQYLPKSPLHYLIPPFTNWITQL